MIVLDFQIHRVETRRQHHRRRRIIMDLPGCFVQDPPVIPLDRSVVCAVPGKQEGVGVEGRVGLYFLDHGLGFSVDDKSRVHLHAPCAIVVPDP